MRLSVRVPVLAAGLAAVVLATTASAAPGAPNTLLVTDPAGDTKVPVVTGYDITGLKLTTTGETTKRKVRGKTVTQYTPKAFVASMTLSAPPNTQPGSTFQFNMDLGGCGYFQLSYTPGAALGDGGVFTECGSPPDDTGSTATLYDIPPSVNGNTITWTMSLKGLSAEFKAGAVMSSLHGYSTYNEPVFGILGPSIIGDLTGQDTAFDSVSSDMTYVIG